MTIKPNTAKAENLAAHYAMVARVAEAWAYGRFSTIDRAKMSNAGFEIGTATSAYYEPEAGIAALYEQDRNRIVYSDHHGETIALRLTTGEIEFI